MEKLNKQLSGAEVNTIYGKGKITSFANLESSLYPGDHKVTIDYGTNMKLFDLELALKLNTVSFVKKEDYKLFIALTKGGE